MTTSSRRGAHRRTVRLTVEVRTSRGWHQVCDHRALRPGLGVVALLDGEQVALFRDTAGDVYAVGNRDPFSGAQVIAHGIVGSRGGAPVVASPMYKQVFDLRDGRCLDGAETPDGGPAELASYPARTVVRLGVPPRPTRDGAHAPAARQVRVT